MVCRNLDHNREQVLFCALDGEPALMGESWVPLLLRFLVLDVGHLLSVGPPSVLTCDSGSEAMGSSLPRHRTRVEPSVLRVSPGRV